MSYSLLSAVHCLSWSIYAGGAICMELVLRHAQNYMKPSQIAVVCQHSGKRYRWWSLFCLLGLLLSGVPMALIGSGGSTASGNYVMVLATLTLLWLALMLTLGLLSFRFHPEMHLRVSSSMTRAQIADERQRVASAITNMDITVRLELGCVILAVALGAAVHLT